MILEKLQGQQAYSRETKTNQLHDPLKLTSHASEHKNYLNVLSFVKPEVTY
jgi:hypothetical protein